ncbi:MAG: hypothetical protein PVI40_02090 [Chlamydiota bacterium]|jgi:hypothetical protein
MSVNLKTSDFLFRVDLPYSKIDSDSRRYATMISNEENAAICQKKNEHIQQIFKDLSRNYSLEVTMGDRVISIKKEDFDGAGETEKLQRFLTGKITELDKILRQEGFSNSSILKIFSLVEQRIISAANAQYGLKALQVDRLNKSRYRSWIEMTKEENHLINVTITSDKNILITTKSQTFICSMNPRVGIDRDKPLMVFQNSMSYDLKSDKLTIENNVISGNSNPNSMPHELNSDIPIIENNAISENSRPTTLFQKIKFILESITQYLENFFNWLFNRIEDNS